MKNKFLDYLLHHKKYSEHTVINYELDINRFDMFLKDKNFKYYDVTYEIVGEYLNHLGTLKLSSSTVVRNTSSLRTFYKYLLKEGYVDINPFTLIQNRKKEKKLPNYIKYNEFEEIISKCGTDAYGIRNKSILEMLIASGLRVSELVNMKLKDIDFKEKSIRIIGKGDKTRIVYYGEYAEESLKYYIENARCELLKNKDSEYVYLNHLGNKLTTRGIELIIDKIIKETALEKNISPHTFRHSFATLMMNEGANVKVVQELLGHSSLETTSIYTHISNDRLRKVYLSSHPRAKK